MPSRKKRAVQACCVQHQESLPENRYDNMGKHTFKEWMIAVRAWSFPASAMPVIVSTAYVYWKFRNGAGAVDGFVLWPAIAALVLMVLLHAAGNTWSDWLDFRKGVDAKDTFGATSLTSGMFTPREIMVISIVIITACILGGIALVIAAGLPLLWIGLGGLACLLVAASFLLSALL